MKRMVPGILSGLGMALLASPLFAAEGGIPPLTERLWSLTGTFHPMIVHFPIALLTLAAIVEGLRLTSKKFKNISPDVTYYCLVIGAAGAVVAATFGWSRAATWGDPGAVFSHRWLGVSITILSVLLAVIATLARRKPTGHVLHKVQLAGVFAAAGLVGLVGHLGGELTYGEGYVEDAIVRALWPEPVMPKVDVPEILVEEPKIEQLVPPLTPIPDEQATVPPVNPEKGVEIPPIAGELGGGQKVDFLSQVWPIFERKCLECHGTTKAKGKLRMDTKDLAFKGGKSGPLWVAFKSSESVILKRIVTDPNDPGNAMPPPEEGEVVTPEEKELIRKWIDEGAVWPVLPGA